MKYYITPGESLHNVPIETTILHCGDYQSTSFSGIEKLTNLTVLYCGGNKLTSLVGIEELTNLTKFDCSYNRLTSLVGIEKLTNLTTLNCSYNQITNLCSEIEELTNLKELYCDTINGYNGNLVDKYHPVELIKIQRWWREIMYK